jgi:hypothetical protein
VGSLDSQLPHVLDPDVETWHSVREAGFLSGNLVVVEEDCFLCDSLVHMLLPSVDWPIGHVPGRIDDLEVLVGKRASKLFRCYKVFLSDIARITEVLHLECYETSVSL